ncbi:hypothetical protein AKO1_008200 [Acrasis kona]|uniref:DJ-1/PfpI domain-containing protein n=1 Tax=Acrasis kona TaxID=1008807 RepID=A0AAW2YMW7_9EUKA
MKTALVFVADGVEEIETVGIVDTLRRGGIEVTMASISKDVVIVASRKVKIVADVLFDEIKDKDFDLLVLPGGADGAKNFSQHEELIKLFQKQKDAGKLYGAICASPAVVLSKSGLLKNISSATCYPALSDQLKSNASETNYNSQDRVVVSENCVTSQGPGTAIEYGLKLIELLVGKEKAEEVRKAMLV